MHAHASALKTDDYPAQTESNIAAHKSFAWKFQERLIKLSMEKEFHKETCINKNSHME